MKFKDEKGVIFETNNELLIEQYKKKYQEVKKKNKTEKGKSNK